MISLLLPKMPRLKTSLHSFEVFKTKTSSNDGNPVRKKMKIIIFNDILGNRLNISWGVILKICLGLQLLRKMIVPKKMQVLENAPYLATLMTTYGNCCFYDTATFSKV